MKSIKDQYWIPPQPFVPSEDIIRQAKFFQVTPEIIQLLHNRGIKESEQIRQFLFPTLNDLVSPFKMKGIKEASVIVAETLQDGGEIIIWGDYDVDGVTATSLLVLFFRHYTNNIRWFIPNRFNQGYGLNATKLKNIIANDQVGQKLLITVDCGIQNHREVELAKAMGCRVIVTDHHEPGEMVVEADAVVNPKMDSCIFPDQDIAGVGLAFYLAMGIRAQLPQNGPNLKQFLDLVAVGTIADMVPLQGSNRVLVKAGFEVLNQSPNPGLAALMEECDIYSGNITSEDISFQIAPKINAAGRMDEAAIAVNLLVASENKECQKLATRLARLNTARKEECTRCLEYTLSIASVSEPKEAGCFVVNIPYSLGILGVVASQLVEKIRVPVILLTEVNDETHGSVLKGSCRSIDDINIYLCLEKCADLLLQFGGHAMAAGVTIKPDKLEEFEQRFSKNISERRAKESLAKKIDLPMTIEQALSPESTKELYLLEPFGNGNKKPIFYDDKVIIQDIRKIGRNGDHLSFVKRGKYENKRCIAFRFGDYERHLQEKPHFDLIYTISISRFKKAEKWQPHLIDIISN